MRYGRKILGAACASLMVLLCGCAMTVDQMYCPPRRSEGFTNLQSVMDAAMQGMVLSAPISGDNQQPVQMLDLDGDTVDEVIVFAKGTQEKPLSIMVFSREGDAYHLSDTIESTGSAFEQVDYVQMDNEPGIKMIVGSQVQNQVLRSFSVYDFADQKLFKLLTANYQKYLTCDIDNDQQQEIVVLNPGMTDTDPGLICTYSMEQGKAEKTADVPLSSPLAQVKRIRTGALSSGQRAVFVTSSLDETTITTDVFAMADGSLFNVALSKESGTDVKILKNDFVYPEDIDHDGVLDLPELFPMYAATPDNAERQDYLIRWYSMDLQGNEETQHYTYHNFPEGWYMELDPEAAANMRVTPEDHGSYSFHIWNEDAAQFDKLWTVYILTGEERSAEAAEDQRFTLLKTESVVYAAELEDAARLLGVNEDQIKDVFHLIQSDWKTGEI